MATCKPCQKGRHKKCIKKNKDKSTGCPGCCQHRVGTNDNIASDGKKVPPP